MALHRVDSLTLGVPDVAAATEFYTDFGLLPAALNSFRTLEGGQQLNLVHTPYRRLVEAGFATDDTDDLDRVAAALASLGVMSERPDPALLSAVEPATGTVIRLVVRPRLRQQPVAAPVYNGPGRITRLNARADGVVRDGPVRPKRLGHLVIGTTNYDATFDFFTIGLGFRVSDSIKDFGAFLRCSTDHHNVLIQRAPVPFLHHTSWQVEDVDEIGRGAMAMLAEHPERHMWGLGRHFAGSNFFWYFKDPAGNFAEYHSDMDCIVDDALWTPAVLEGAKGLFQWGPPPPPSFIDPEDLADLMISGHSS